MRPGPDLLGLEQVSLLAEAAALEAEAALLAADISMGVVPPDSRRARSAVEVAAQTNFAALSNDTSRIARLIEQTLLEERATVAGLLAALLRSLGSWEAVMSALLAIREQGWSAVEGVDSVVATVGPAVIGALQAGRLLGLERVLNEARSQGVRVADPTESIVAALEPVLVQLGRRATLSPLEQVLGAWMDFAAASTGRSVDSLVGALLGINLSDLRIRDAARQVSAAANGLGRQAALAQTPEPQAIYASELLDENVCGPCSLIDGHQYQSIEEARQDYPVGLYAQCLGGLRCRGTLVFVWDETPPGIGL